MLNLWLFYNLLLTSAVIVTSLNSARTYPQFILPLLLLPVFYFLFQDLRKKLRRRGFKSHSVFASSVSRLPSTALAKDSALEGEVIKMPRVSDSDRRLFLKLIGSTGLSLFFMALVSKKAQAAFFGSVPGPGTVAVKNIAGNTIDPAELQPTDGYEISEVDDAATPSYYGFVHKTGAWYITKEDATGAYRYWKGSSGFSAAWDLRDDPDTSYGYFDSVFSAT